MKHEVLLGQTDYTVLVKIRDTAGAPATGLTEASIDIAYARVETDNDVTTTDVTPAALTALTDAHTDWGFEEVSATDHPGLYRLDIADAVFASGAWSAVVTVTGTGLDPADLEFVLIAFNPRDAVRLGLTALPNAAADAAGGLPISDAGGLDLDNRMPSAAAVTGLNTSYAEADGAAPILGIVDQGTAQSASATGVVLRAAAAFADDTLIGCTIGVLGSDQGYWQFREITDNALTGDAVTVETWTVTPTGTITYKIYAAPPASATLPAVNVTQVSGDGAAADVLELFAEALDGTTGQIDSGTFAAGAITAAAIADGAIDAATFAANAITSTVIADDAITAAKLATGALTADAFAADALVAATFATGALTADAFAADALVAATFATGALTADAFAADALVAATFAADCITAAKVAADVHQETIELAFTYDATANYAGAAAGSLVKEIADNAGGSALTTDAICEAMFTFDATATYATANAGSVVKQIADNAGGSSLTVADIADGVWDEATAGHVAAGSFGKLAADVLEDTGTTLNTHLTDMKGATFDGSTDSLEALRNRGDSAWITATSVVATSVTGDVAGRVLGGGASIITGVGANCTLANGAVTANAIASNAITAAKIADDALTAAKFATDSISADALAADAVTEIVAGMNNLSAADVNAEVVDALATDTYAEPGQGAPAATTSLAAKINYLYKAWRNKKTKTATATNLYADDGTTIDQKTTDSDDGTTGTRGEVVTGP